MNNHKLLKIAGVLLLSAVLFFSATAVTANTKTLTTSTKTNTYVVSNPTSRDVVWDNGATDGSNLASSQFDSAYPFQSQVADDFLLMSANDITGVTWWGYFWNGPPTEVNPCDFNIIFYADDGTGNMPTGAGMDDPTSTALAVYFFPAVMGSDVGGYFEYAVTLPTAFSASGATTYWIAIQAVVDYPPQWGWAVSLDQTMHPSMQGFPLLGTVYWTDAGFGDVSFQLLGGSPSDTTPPVTTCDITGTNPVTVTLTATDDMSGVNYTKYKLDDGAWTTYSVPIVVSVGGNHTVYFYSVDMKGNVEEEKSATFTVEAAAITITIKGGLGVSATIKNTGTTELTNIDWTITLDGKLIFIGKTKTNTIASLAPGASVTVKDFVIGFGKTGIAVEAGTATASATGTVLLILVIGVA